MINLTDIKYFLNINTNDEDNFLMTLIDMTIARIDNYCKRKVNYSRINEIIDGKNNDSHWLKNIPVEKIESIYFRENGSSFDYDLFSGLGVTENLYLEQETGRIILLNGFRLPNGKSNIRIKYYAGYVQNAEDPVNELPNDLKYAALLMTAEAYLKSFRDTNGDYAKRLGLEKIDLNRGSGDSALKLSMAFKSEDYTNILKKYINIKI